jgi:cell shape-determining protein MreC
LDKIKSLEEKIKQLEEENRKLKDQQNGQIAQIEVKETKR